MMLKTVVLPAPFGPMIVKTSPFSDVETDIVDSLQTTKLHRYAVGFEVMLCSFQPVRFLEGFLTAEHALAVEGKQREIGPQFQPGSIDSDEARTE